LTPQLLSDANLKKREDWESFKIGAGPAVIRNARQPGSPYFPVENTRPETTTRNQFESAISGTPTTSEEAETGDDLELSDVMNLFMT
jgi:hypothetical protein